MSDIVALLEETINQVRRRQIEHRAANAIGYLSGIALKALQEATIEARLTHLENIAEWKKDDDSKPFKFVSVESK